MTIGPVGTENLHPLVAKVRSSPPPIARLIGFELETVEPGHTAALLDAGPQHENPTCTLHGGVLCDLADAAMDMAFASMLTIDGSFTTIHLALNLFRRFSLPIWKLRE